MCGCGLEHSLLQLVKLRALQINSGVFCIDLRWEDLQTLSEEEQRLKSLDAWSECPLFTDRERAALAWTETMTLLSEGGIVPDSDYYEARTEFSEKELSDLTLAIATVNAWNLN